MSIIFFTDTVLAHPISSPEGDLLYYVVPSESRLVLETLQERAIQTGIIVNLGKQWHASVEQVLKRSGLLSFIEPELVIYGDRYTHSCFVEAAAKARLAPNQCIFAGENSTERIHALQAGFVAAIPHPSLVLEVMDGGSLTYARVSNLNGKSKDERLERLLELPVVPLHLTPTERGSAYVITSTRAAEATRNFGFDMTTFDHEHDPQVTDLYLAHDDRKTPEGVSPEKYSADFLGRHGRAGFIVSQADNTLFLALPADVSIEEIHFPNAIHGHNRRLLADTSLWAPLIDPAPTLSTRASLKTAANVTLSEAEVKTLKEVITLATLKRLHAPYIGDAPLDASGHLVTTRHFASEDNRLVTQALARHLQQIGGGLMTVRLRGFTLNGVSLNNIEAELPGSETNSFVIISAHLDSTARLDGVTDPAPGADDDASGVAGVLAAAEAAVKLRAAGQLKRSLRFILFNAEEENMYGSQRYAGEQKKKRANIVAVFQMDMIGYSGGALQKEFEVHVGCLGNPQVGIASLELARRIRSVFAQISPVLNSPQIYPTASGSDALDGRSDHTPFLSLGYKACLITEDGTEGPLATSPTPRVNGDYHRRSDKKIDYGYAAEIARVVAAAAILTAKS